MLDKVNGNSKFYRRITKNQDIIKNPEFMKVARQFFYDEKNKSLKSEATGIIQRFTLCSPRHGFFVPKSLKKPVFLTERV